MKRNFNLIREIALGLEACPADHIALVTPEPWRISDIGSWTICFESYNEVTDHLTMMEEVGLIKLGVIKRSHTEVKTVTMKGHDFIALSRDQYRWNTALECMSIRDLAATWDNLLMVLNDA